jgi:hypothetical protein
MHETPKLTGLALLREAFPAHQISKLPKPFKKDSPKGNCRECGGYHGLPAMHLDYVGHAALTDRLLDADLKWTWAPVPDPASLGLPVVKDGMWITLTVCGVSRFGFGCADGKTGGDAVKELIGDALRNAAMRFGAALDLWHKGQLHEDEEPVSPPSAPDKYEGWLMDLEAKSDEGYDALVKAITNSDEVLRNRLKGDGQKWAALKRRAEKAKVAA